MKPILRWGILGTGKIARQFLAALEETPTSVAIAAGSRSAESSIAFRSEFPHLRCHAHYADLIADKEVDAVYVATPHPFHLQWASAALAAGKYVLCEKPMTMNAGETSQLIEAARTARRGLVEAFRYRFHPQTRKLVELAGSGILGEIRLIEASFCFAAKFDPASRLFHSELGGGAILDVGCYTMSMCRLLAGAAEGLRFANPIRLQGEGTLDATGVDRFALAQVRFASGIIGRLRCSTQLQTQNLVTVHGSDGWLSVSEPWHCAKPGEAAIIHLHRGGEVSRIETVSDLSPMALEIEAVAALHREQALESSCMPWADSLGNAEALDAWIAALRNTPA